MIVSITEKKSETEDEFCLYEFDWCVGVKENGKLREIEFRNNKTSKSMTVTIKKTTNIDITTENGNKVMALSVNKE